MQSPETIMFLRRARVENQEEIRQEKFHFLARRYISLVEKYHELGRDTKELVSAIGDFFDPEVLYQQDCRFLEGKLDLYAREVL